MILIIDKTDFSSLRKSDLNLDQKAEIQQEIRAQVNCTRMVLDELECPAHGSKETAATVHLRLHDGFSLYYDITNECCESLLAVIPEALADCLQGIHTDPPAYEPEC